jgi:hypothetical protein
MEDITQVMWVPPIEPIWFMARSITGGLLTKTNLRVPYADYSAAVYTPAGA